jgi:hypothetical protein
MSKRFGRNQKRKLLEQARIREYYIDRLNDRHDRAIHQQKTHIEKLRRQIDDLVNTVLQPKARVMSHHEASDKPTVAMTISAGALRVERRLDAVVDYRALLMGQDTKEALILNVARQLVDAL